MWTQSYVPASGGSLPHNPDSSRAAIVAKNRI
jgi:hypothetical protein